MKKYIILLTLLFWSTSYSMDQTKNTDEKDNDYVVDEYGSEITKRRCDVIEKVPLSSDEKPRVIWVKGRMRRPRPVILPRISADQKKQMLSDQVAKMRARL